MNNKLKQLDYKNSVGFLSRSASKLLEKALDAEILLAYGLSGAQWKVIGALAFRNGLSQKELADFLELDSSTLVPVIDRLEKNQFVTRKPDPKDRRHNRIFITKKSESSVDSIVSAIFKLRKSAYKDISARDMEIAKKVLKKVVENIEIFTSKQARTRKKK